MRRHALLGVLAAISCARPTMAWDYQCWDCVAFRASLEPEPIAQAEVVPYPNR